MFEDTYAGDEVKRILKMRVGNVIIYNVIMPVQHSRGPVVVHIVRGCNQKPAVAHQVRQRRSTGAHIQNVSRIDFPEFSEDKATLQLSALGNSSYHRANSRLISSHKKSE
jgi:hypothetical protein